MHRFLPFLLQNSVLSENELRHALTSDLWEISLWFKTHSLYLCLLCPKNGVCVCLCVCECACVCVCEWVWGSVFVSTMRERGTFLFYLKWQTNFGFDGTRPMLRGCCVSQPFSRVVVAVVVALLTILKPFHILFCCI